MVKKWINVFNPKQSEGGSRGVPIVINVPKCTSSPDLEKAFDATQKRLPIEN